MPLLVTYDGRPVRYHRRVPGGLLLILYAPQSGTACPRLFVTQAQWSAHSRAAFFPHGAKPDVRALAAAPSTSATLGGESR